MLASEYPSYTTKTPAEGESINGCLTDLLFAKNVTLGFAVIGIEPKRPLTIIVMHFAVVIIIPPWEILNPKLLNNWGTFVSVKSLLMIIFPVVIVRLPSL